MSENKKAKEAVLITSKAQIKIHINYITRGTKKAR